MHKSASTYLPTNYRLISILSPFAKIFEQIIHDKLDTFFTKNNIISSQQYGFRKNHSTSLAVLDLLSVLLQNKDKEKISCSIFLDISKAFDTVNHNILLQKLNRYGIRGEMHNLLKDYLTDRKQFTTYKNAKSDDAKIVCGIPQGSILGPLLFSIYLNDLPLVTDSHIKLLQMTQLSY